MNKLNQNTTGLQNILEAANSIDTEVNTQSNLLAQIVAALEGKANGSGDSGDINIEPFSQMVIGTITPASTMTTFTIPAEITDKIVLFAVGYIGSNPLSPLLLSTAVWAHFTTNTRGEDGIATSYLVGAASTGNSGQISISGNNVSFGSYYLYKGWEYVYIVCTRQNRSTASLTSGGGSN